MGREPPLPPPGEARPGGSSRSGGGLIPARRPRSRPLIQVWGAVRSPPPGIGFPPPGVGWPRQVREARLVVSLTPAVPLPPLQVPAESRQLRGGSARAAG